MRKKAEEDICHIINKLKMDNVEYFLLKQQLRDDMKKYLAN